MYGMRNGKKIGGAMSERYIYVLGRTDRIVKIQDVRISLNHM